jgi:uncharacterized protein
MFEYLIIGIIAFLTSVLSGLLGLGGAVLLIPAYLYLPQLLGAPPIDVKLITGMTSVQVFASSLSGMLMHRRKGAVNTRLVYMMGIPILLASFLGAASSVFINAAVIIAIFAFLTVLGAALMIIRKEQYADLQPEGFRLNAGLAVTIAVLVGYFGGIAGAPGAFILSPLMMTVLKIPTRITIGSTLGIVLLSSGSASVGKFITGQVPIDYTVVAIVASVPGVLFGSMFSHQLKAKTLRVILALLITMVGLEMWYQIIFN